MPVMTWRQKEGRRGDWRGKREMKNSKNETMGGRKKREE